MDVDWMISAANSLGVKGPDIGHWTVHVIQPTLVLFTGPPTPDSAQVQNWDELGWQNDRPRGADQHVLDTCRRAGIDRNIPPPPAETSELRDWGGASEWRPGGDHMCTVARVPLLHARRLGTGGS